MSSSAAASGYNAPADTVLVTKKEVLQQLGWFCDQVQGKKHAGPTEAEATASENTKIDTYLKKEGVTKLMWEGQERYMWHKDSRDHLHAASVLKEYVDSHGFDKSFQADYIHWTHMLPEFGWSSKTDKRGIISGPPGQENINRTNKRDCYVGQHDWP